MDKNLRKALESRGLPAESGERDAQDFYAHLPTNEKGTIGTEVGREAFSNGTEPLQTRDTDDELTTRSMSFRAATVNEEERSVEATIATDRSVEVYDWARGERIEEVLLAEGAVLPTRMPLLNNHSRWSLDDVLGSARQLRTDGGEMIGRLFFAEGDADADKAWNKVRQGHITDVSVGYRVEEATEIQPGQSATIRGRTFTAKNRTLRVATRWVPKEVSIVAIGADQAAKMRKANQFPTQGGIIVPETNTNISPDDEQRTDADASQPDEQRKDVPETPETPTQPAEPQRQETPEDPGVIAQRAVTAERQRVTDIRSLAGDDVPAEMSQRAIDEGWTEDRCRGEFLTAVREGRAPSAGPAMHIRSHDTDCNVRSLAAGMLMGQGLDPTKCSLHQGRTLPRRADVLTEQDADLGEEFRAMSAIDLVRECAMVDSGRYHRDPGEAMRAATSGGTLSYVFSTNVYARLIAGWETIGDTTLGWCDEEDVPNFLQQEDISLQANARLDVLPRGGTAKHATASDSHETYKIARYAKQFVVDEQDVIDDRLGAIMRMPAEMGEAARKFRPDLVYSLLLENPSLVATTGALFNATAVTTTGGHKNLGSGVLAAAGMKAAISAMGKQRLNKNVLNIRPRFLIVPAELEWTARELTASAALTKLFADSSDPYYSQLNLLAKEGIRVVVDDRIGAGGVVDPRTGSTRTGTDTQWFMAQGGSKSIRVAYRRGTNRQPVMRSFSLDKGQWGIGWDINLDIGAAPMDYRGWYKSTGA